MERNQCFTTGKPISESKGNMHCLSKEWRCQVPNQKLRKNSSWLEWLGDKEVSRSRGRVNMPERTGAWPSSPSKPQVDVRATLQGLPHLRGAILLPKNAFLGQSSRWLTHNILEDSRKPGQFGDTQKEAGDPISTLHSTSWAIGETLTLITRNMLFPLDFRFFWKVSFGKNAIKSSVILSKWPYEEGKMPSSSSFPITAQGPS